MIDDYMLAKCSLPVCSDEWLALWGPIPAVSQEYTPLRPLSRVGRGASCPCWHALGGKEVSYRGPPFTGPVPETQVLIGNVDVHDHGIFRVGMGGWGRYSQGE